MMFCLLVTLFLWSCSANELTEDSGQKDRFPCMTSDKVYSYDNFLKRHLSPHAPTSLDKSAWHDFIKEIGTCNRPVQSFIPHDKKNQVDDVCSASGGKIYAGDLCVSEKEFTFFTIIVDGNCTVQKVTEEKKFIILACDKIDDHCRPVHFQPNPDNKGPEKGSKACRGGNSAESAHLSRGLLLLTLLSSVLFYNIA